MWAEALKSSFKRKEVKKVEERARQSQVPRDFSVYLDLDSVQNAIKSFKFGRMPPVHILARIAKKLYLLGDLPGRKVGDRLMVEVTENLLSKLIAEEKEDRPVSIATINSILSTAESQILFCERKNPSWDFSLPRKTLQSAKKRLLDLILARSEDFYEARKLAEKAHEEANAIAAKALGEEIRKLLLEDGANLEIPGDEVREAVEEAELEGGEAAMHRLVAIKLSIQKLNLAPISDIPDSEKVV